MSNQFKVFGARCLVEEIKNSSTTKSGIIINGAEKEPTYHGIVVAVGNGAILENGTRVPMDVKVGDEIVYTTFSGSPISDGEKDYLILNERDILCVVVNNDNA